MHFISAHKESITIIFTAIVVLLFLIVLWQILFIKFHHGAVVEVPAIPRSAELFGTTGTEVNFVVMGDSTSIGQGAEYGQGIARMSAVYLAQKHQVSLTNVGVSGARVADVLHDQTAKAVAIRPDLVLISIGANDVTHLSSIGSVKKNITSVITQLQSANPKVKIILTGSPAMGSVPRFAVPTQWLAAWRVKQINSVFTDVAKQTNVILLPLAKDTGPTFKAHPELFATDNFHPTAAGYAVWQPVITRGLVQAGY